MDVDARGFVDGLREYFADLKDPRHEKSCDHLLLDIVAIAVLSVACGADDWCDMATFAELKLDWLKTFLALPGGAPSHDTFRRVFGLIDRKRFAANLFRWTRALHEVTGGKLIAIDGKTQRRTFSTRSGSRALHLVTAWASENGLTLGQVACEEKSNEITAIPELLKLLSLKVCTVTIDAMGCQTEIVEEIRQQRGHYVLAVKDNQPTLRADLREIFEGGWTPISPGPVTTGTSPRRTPTGGTRGACMTRSRSRGTTRSGRDGATCGRWSWPRRA